MDVVQAMESRSSCRVFTDRPVDRALIEEVLNLTVKAPSALNLQPWLFTVVRGEELGRLSRRLVKAWAERGVGCAPAAARPLPEIYTARQKELFAVMGPAIRATTSPWDDFTNQGSLHFYGAPAAIIVSGEAALEHEAQFDLGLAVGYLLLACQAKGLGTCPIGLVSRYGELLADTLNIPDGRPTVLALAVGYPDETAPINLARTNRAPITETVRWY